MAQATSTPDVNTPEKVPASEPSSKRGFFSFKAKKPVDTDKTADDSAPDEKGADDVLTVSKPADKAVKPVSFFQMFRYVFPLSYSKTV